VLRCYHTSIPASPVKPATPPGRQHTHQQPIQSEEATEAGRATWARLSTLRLALLVVGRLAAAHVVGAVHRLQGRQDRLASRATLVVMASPEHQGRMGPMHPLISRHRHLHPVSRPVSRLQTGRQAHRDPLVPLVSRVHKERTLTEEVEDHPVRLDPQDRLGSLEIRVKLERPERRELSVMYPVDQALQDRLDSLARQVRPARQEATVSQGRPDLQDLQETPAHQEDPGRQEHQAIRARLELRDMADLAITALRRELPRATKHLSSMGDEYRMECCHSQPQAICHYRYWPPVVPSLLPFS